MAQAKPPKLSVSKECRFVPPDVQELQDKMVNRFQFEKLIPDKLQETFSEYVGQLEQDYAELYPLIKEFADWTAEQLPRKTPDGLDYLVKEFNNPQMYEKIVARPYKSQPDFWLLFMRSSTTIEMPDGTKPTWIKIGLSKWPDQRFSPDWQGTVYCQAVPNLSTKVGESSVFSFIRAQDQTNMSHISVKGEFWVGKIDEITLETYDRNRGLEQMPNNLKAAFYQGQTIILQAIEFENNSSAKNKHLCKVTRIKSRQSPAHKNTSIEQYYRDMMNASKHLPEYPSVVMTDNLEGGIIASGKTMTGNQGREAILHQSGDHMVYEGGFDPETFMQDGEGSLFHSAGPLTDSGTFEQGSMVKGRRETETYIYEGQFQDSTPHGTGVITWQNGAKYSGEFKYGEPNGQGTYKYNDKAVYQGEMKEGKLHGRGCLTLPDGGKFEGNFEKDHMVDGSIHFTTSTWNVSDSLSALLQGLMLGPKGLIISVRVCLRFLYESIANRFRKPEQKVWAAIYTGQTNTQNEMEGFGKLSDLSGFSYEGEFHAHRPHGFGTAINIFGDKYTGEFREGAYHGRGRLESPIKGQVYEGYFLENSYHGRGTLYTVKKNSVEKTTGLWESGELPTPEVTTTEPYSNQPLTEIGKSPTESDSSKLNCSTWSWAFPEQLHIKNTNISMVSEASFSSFSSKLKPWLWCKSLKTTMQFARVEVHHPFVEMNSIRLRLMAPVYRDRLRASLGVIGGVSTTAILPRQMKFYYPSLFKLALTKRM